tara:strand:+ start:496 stop:759 length:264 start_codon:yes stop_codon:yes gene_type:complete
MTDGQLGEGTRNYLFESVHRGPNIEPRSRVKAEVGSVFACDEVPRSYFGEFNEFGSLSSSPHRAGDFVGEEWSGSSLVGVGDRDGVE